MNTKIPHIVILYDQPLLPTNHPDAESEYHILLTVKAVQDCLVEAGFDITLLAVGTDPDPMLAALRHYSPDAIFNLCEATVSRPEIEANVASLLEWTGIPFTGCPALALRLCLDKPLSKKLLRGAGLRTADWLVVEQLPVPACPFSWPVIVKPGREDGSSGIDHGSVVTSQAQMEKRAHYLLEQYGPPVLIEQYLPGRELRVAMVELPNLRTMPICEIQHLNPGPGYWPIITYDAKWAIGSRDDLSTKRQFPDDLAPDVVEELRQMAMDAFRMFMCRDLATVDFRLNAEGRPCILEVNPNPDYNPDAGFRAQVEAGGISWVDFTVQMAHGALPRTKTPKSTLLVEEVPTR